MVLRNGQPTGEIVKSEKFINFYKSVTKKRIEKHKQPTKIMVTGKNEMDKHIKSQQHEQPTGVIVKNKNFPKFYKTVTKKRMEKQNQPTMVIGKNEMGRFIRIPRLVG